MPPLGLTAGTGTAITTAGDCFISPQTYNGTFAAGAWIITLTTRCTVTGAQGRLRMRVWRSANANGTSATELTSGAIVGSIINHNATPTDFTSTLTWSPGAITLTNEYLFFQIEWQETTLGASTCNVLFRIGTASIRTTSFDAVPVLATALLAPNAILAANSRRCWRHQQRSLPKSCSGRRRPTTSIRSTVRALISPHPVSSHWACNGCSSCQVTAWAGAALLAPAANLAVNEVLRLAAQAALAPSATFGADAQTFIFDTAERLTPAAALTAAVVQTMAAATTLAPAAALDRDSNGANGGCGDTAPAAALDCRRPHLLSSILRNDWPRLLR